MRLWPRLALGFGALLLASELILRIRHVTGMAAWASPVWLLRPGARLGDTACSESSCLLVLGDSIAYGQGVAEAEAWPARLQALLQTRGQRWRVINAGIPGETVLQGLVRVRRDVLRYRPKGVLVAFGLNDGHLQRSGVDAWREQEIVGPLNGSFLARSLLLRRLRGYVLTALRRTATVHPAAKVAFFRAEPRVGPDHFREGLRRLVQTLQEDDIQVWLLTTTPIDERFHPEWPRARWRRQVSTYAAYNDIVRAVAAETNAGLIDMAGVFAHFDLSTALADDGVHLTAMGQQRVAGIVAEWLMND